MELMEPHMGKILPNRNNKSPIFSIAAAKRMYSVMYGIIHWMES